jgi:hypothetical protein
MPYIKKETRLKCDEIVNAMIQAGIEVNGDLNYVLFKFCKVAIKPSYNNYKNFCGELHQCATEIERRILAKYEDEKILENGDVE